MGGVQVGVGGVRGGGHEVGNFGFGWSVCQFQAGWVGDSSFEAGLEFIRGDGRRGSFLDEVCSI